MKTSEFIKKMKSLGYEVRYGYGNIYIGYDSHTILQVREHMFGSIDTQWSEFTELEQDEQENILEVAYTYITTPLVEREEPKKYYLRLPKDFIGEDLSDAIYLNFNRSEKTYLFENKPENEFFQTKFTQEEIDKLDTTHLIKEEVQ